MARLAGGVAPGLPHHVTQRGNRRQVTLFGDGDHLAYLEPMAEPCDGCGVAVWAYCLMPNHSHLTVVPQTEDGLRRAIGEAHRRYTRMVNFREGWRGHLWQGRFASSVRDQEHLIASARYVELSPVRAGLRRGPQDYAHSGAAAHLKGGNDGSGQVAPLPGQAAGKRLSGRSSGAGTQPWAYRATVGK